MPRIKHRIWKSFASEDLALAVEDNEPALLLGLFREAVDLGWLVESPENQERFLAVCHNVVQIADRPAGLLVAILKRGLDEHHVNQDDWSFAREAMRIDSGQVEREVDEDELTRSGRIRERQKQVQDELRKRCYGKAIDEVFRIRAELGLE